MRPAGTIDQYLANPLGRYFIGPSFLHFVPDATLCGTVFWDRPDEGAIRLYTRVVEVELPRHTPPHAAFVDTRHLTGVDDAAFQTLAAYVGPLATVFGDNVTKQALVRPAGALGALVAGFYEVTPAAYPDRTRVFADAPEALRWLGRADGPKLLATLDELRGTALGTPATVRALRDFLASHLKDAAVGVADAARALGMSPRTLQHQLQAAGTSFRRELNAARVRAAQRMLETTATKLTVIALEVGCASLQHFSTLFRKETGQSPSDWRAQKRGAPARSG